MAALIALMMALGVIAVLVLVPNGPAGWWTLPALWLVTMWASVGIYLMPPGIHGRDSFHVRLALAALVCSGIALGVSWRWRPRVPVWQTLPTAMAGVATPPAALFLLLIIACDGGACLS